MTEQVVISTAITVSREIDGIEMGVLADGTTYLTERGVARFCGVSHAAIQHHRAAWSARKGDNRLVQKLLSEGYNEPELYFRIQGADGGVVYAYPESVCQAFLGYYAFDAQTTSEVAQQNVGKLLQAGLRLFVYSALGYDPKYHVPSIWQHFHDRMLLVTAPEGYFGVFKEAADFVLLAIKGGLPCDEHTIPDISIGRLWASQWVSSGLEQVHGPRIRHEHNYPDYFPQAKSNPQEAWAYPISVLPTFRTWLHLTYLPDKFPRYVQDKVKKGTLPPAVAAALLGQALPDETKRMA